MDITLLQNAYFSEKKVLGIYFGNNLVWPLNILWTFDNPSLTTTVSNMNITTNPPGTITISWGDGTPNTIVNSGVNASHTY